MNIPPAERGIAELTVDVYLSFAEPLTHETLFKWHAMLTQGRADLKDVARYRTHSEPMQVVSGPIYEPKVYFEAPPSGDMTEQMAQFIGWFNKTAPFGMEPIPNLIRAGIAHLYFVSIHPFEDGNGRIGRALVSKVLSQSLGYPALIALSETIQAKRKDYYKMLEHSNQSLEINEWLRYFAQVILRAQESAKDMIYFLIEKTKLYDRVKGVLNPRQEKVLSRVFQEGLKGFKGGLSAENYIKLTKTSRATATRDLQDLVDKNVFVSSGIGKGTRYHLNVARS
jgi:Fic family protein